MDKLPERFRTLSRENRPAATALAAALALGHDYNSMPVHYVAVGDGYRVLNLRDDVLLDLRDDDLRRLGYWDIRRLDPRGVRDGAPAFCRNGNGHPVWGREWCIDKGFGLGASNGWLWGRHRPDDVVFMRIGDNSRADRRSLLDVLGSVVFNRLAVHSLTLGLTDPLAGQWIGEPTGPRVLMLNSGNVQVAELVDWDRDGTVDVMYVVSR